MARKKKGTVINGWVNIDKPIGMTSTQVIGRVRRLTNAQKLGHAGTLDPLATGILPIALGEATKTISFAQDHDKVYRFTVKWGEARNTDDAEGEVIASSDKRPSAAEIQTLIPRFLGNIEQVPPQFSAIKVDGERAYALARAGEDVELHARTVTVYALRLLRTFSSSPSPPAPSRAGEGRGEGGGEAGRNLAESAPGHPTPLTPTLSRPQERGEREDSAEFELECGKGTYVRSIARDMGQILGCFGHVSALRRTAVGCFSENNAISLDALEEMMQSPDPDRYVLPVETVLDDIPVLAMTATEISRIRQGQSLKFISRQDFDRFAIAGIDEMTGTILAVGDNKPLALLSKEGVELKPVRLFNL